MKMTYVIGHKKPDTDSVCASISYSYLKNKLGWTTEPRVLGNINKETKFALDYFKVESGNRQPTTFVYKMSKKDSEALVDIW